MSEEKKELSQLPPSKEKLRTISVGIRPSDYASMKRVADDLGLGVGACIRFALVEFLRTRENK